MKHFHFKAHSVRLFESYGVYDDLYLLFRDVNEGLCVSFVCKEY